ncbi:MAG: DUF4338 domain-containing protein [Planctomycetes bacterium]|nr:DUF4338 domain-containing protein [Planctomycetota bacterium]
MTEPEVWSGRIFSPEDINLIKTLIRQNPSAKRSELSRLVCEQLNWRDSSGRLKAMRCRVVMLRMTEKGMFTLPPPQFRKSTVRHRILSTPATDPKAAVTQPVHELNDLRIDIVTAKDKVLSRLWNEYIHRYHYLGYEPCIGANIRYMVWSNGELIALLGFGAAAWQIAPRDNFIGWNHDLRKLNLKYIVNNTRFLILPWVNSKNLASWILSQINKRLPCDWMVRYGYSPYLMETFVDSSKYSGHCYKASNWKLLGRTTGRGKYENKKVAAEKDIWVCPLRKDFAKKLLKV